MELIEFKKRYEAQLLLGKAIELLIEIEYDDVNKLLYIANDVCPNSSLFDAHWRNNPYTIDEAVALFYDENIL